MLLEDGRVGQMVGLGVVFAANVGYGEIEGAGQLAADPVQGIEARAATGVLAPHLFDHDLGIRIDVKRPCF